MMASTGGSFNSCWAAIVRLPTILLSSIEAVYHALTAALLAAFSGLKWLYRFANGGTPTEADKTVVNNGWGSILMRLSVHFLPLCASLALAALNLLGYFIGHQFPGLNDDTTQDIDRLLLQIAAKLYELLIVASLTTILWDVLRSELLYNTEGLPYGLLSAPRRFVELQFFLSPSFWYGHAGITSLWKRIAFILLLLFSGTIALFAGPASALLMIPQDVVDWPAGGADVNLIGSNETLWPSELLSWPDYDAAAQLDMLVNSTGSRDCIACNSVAMAQSLQGWHFGSTWYDIVLTDGLVRRSVGVMQPGPAENTDTWAISPHLTPCVYSKLLGTMWLWWASYNAPKAKNSGLYRHYRDREFLSTTSTVKSQIPLVRTNCATTTVDSFSDVETPGARYPMQPNIGPTVQDYFWISPTPQMPFTSYYNDSSVTTQWFVPTSDATIGGERAADGSIVGLSSAFMNIQIPAPNSSTSGVLLACSIDARWAEGDITGSKQSWWNGADTFNASITVGPLVYPYSGYDFPALEEVKLRNVRLGREWLDALTPAFDSSRPGVTSLSKTLIALGVNQTINFDLNWNNNVATAQAAISAIVADGMAKTGYNENGGSAFIEAQNGLGDVLQPPREPADLNALLDRKYIMPPLTAFAANLSKVQDESGNLQTTQVRWELVIAGLAYKANSTAYYLALTIVFAHAVLAIGHMIWILFKGQVSTAWESHGDMMALAINSQPAHEFANTSGGIKSLGTWRKPVRLRDVTAGPNGPGVMYNQLQLVIGAEDKSIVAWDDVKAEQKYF